MILSGDRNKYYRLVKAEKLVRFWPVRLVLMTMSRATYNKNMAIQLTPEAADANDTLLVSVAIGANEKRILILYFSEGLTETLSDKLLNRKKLCFPLPL